MSDEREVVIVEEKPWWTSKTMVFNIVVAVLLAVELNFPSLQTHIAPELYAYLAMAINAANVALRAITSGPVTMK
jgi:hypothetical protein